MGNGLPTVEDVADGCKQDASAARSSFPQLTTPQYNKLEGICWAIAKKYYPRFRNHPATSLDDLFQTALTGAHSTLGGAIKAHHEFDPARGSYSVWIGKRASAAILDHLKRSNRHNAQDEAGEVAYSKRDDYQQASSTSVSLLEKIPERFSARGRKGFGANPWVNVHAYMHEHGLSYRQMWNRLRIDAKLVGLLKFKHCPSWGALCGSKARLRKLGKQL